MGVEYRTTDVDAFCSTVSHAVRTSDGQRCHVRPRIGRYDARLRHDRIGDLGLTTIEYGNAVRISLDPMSYMLHVPLAGGFRARSGGGRELEVASDALHIVNPQETVRMDWDARCRVLVVPVVPGVLRDHGRALSGRPPRGALPGSLPLTTPQGATFRRWIEFVRGEAAEEASGLASVGARQAEQMFFGLLFALLQPDGALAQADTPPFYVRRAEEYIDARLEDDIGLLDIVAASEASLRTLHRAFRQRHGVGPMAWLKLRRLERVHEVLREAEPGTTSVTEVALRFRLWHLGRFSRSYQALFGELPSQTLKGRR